MANKGRVHAMIAEYLENTFSVSEQPLPSDDVVISHSPDIPPLPDSDLFPPPIANLSVTPFSINSDFRGDLYIPCDPKFPSYVALASTALHVRRHVRMRKLYDTARLRATVARDQTARVRSKQLVYYESKFILDSFLFWVFPARFLRWLAANINLLPRSRVCSRDLFGLDTVRF